MTDFGFGRLTGVRVTEPIVFELEVVLGILRHAGFKPTGVNVTDGVTVLFPNVVIVEDSLTVGGLIPPGGTTKVGKAAGGGGGNGLVPIPTMSLMFLLVLFPGNTRGGG